MKITQEKVYGWIGSASMVGLLLLLLLFVSLRSLQPDEDEGGVLVNFGYVDEAAGTFEPAGEYVPQEQTQAAKPTPSLTTPDQSSITQRTEESIALAQEKKAKAQQAEQERLQREAEQRKKREEQERIQNINQQMAGAFGSNPGSQGTAQGQGKQGSTEGNANTGLDQGIGGYGNFSLAGRSLGAEGLPKPAYVAAESGVIVVSITVNPQGEVIATGIARGTTIDNAAMREAALKAARKAKFNRIDGLNNQSGTITYRYRLN